ncbi:helix-turn-helix domain-containing protein [Flavobacterium hydatis]|nr:helix-turn-helix transcriptional regulator [Flavobacterium hydatis]
MKNRKFNKMNTNLLVIKSNIIKNIGTTNRTDILFKLSLIAFVKKALEENIKFRITISLRKLLQSKGKDAVPQSYNDIATAADIRKATVSDTFNAKSIPSSSTLILILKAMGSSLSDFEKIFDSLKDSDILAFKRGLV